MKYKVTLNEKVYEVEVEKGEAILIDEYVAAAPVAMAPVVVAPASAPSAEVAAVPAAASAPIDSVGDNTVISPLPGSILNIAVKVGDSVNQGDLLLVIEAMKMENEVVAARDGKVTSIAVSKGETVETGAPLLNLE